MKKHWTILPQDAGAAAALAESLRIPPALCQILVQRGITDFESARHYFRPSLESLHSPWLMKDMDKAVDRLVRALDNGENILVYGDYDVDGTTSAASFLQFLRQLHPPDRCDFYIPHRYREGYGVSQAGIDFAHNQGYTLIVSIDCGIKSVELVEYAAERGIDFIICDHHTPGDELPRAAAILNPKQADCTYPYRDLCGCGIGFKLMQALCERLHRDPSLALAYIDLVAVAIAADIVPMTGENRILAFHGLKKINENPCLGIRTLIEQANLRKKWNIGHVVFIIAPRVNAAGRMDDARKAVELFMEQDPTAARDTALALQTDNSDRKETDSQITAEALDMIHRQPEKAHHRSCVLFHEHWHKGVVGIVASRVIEQYYRPTIILTQNDGLITGSARSVRGFNVYEAIYACREHLTAYGGHFAAAGLSLLPEQLPHFERKFEEVVSRTITPESLYPEIVVDTELRLPEVTDALCRIVEQMGPFGPENMNPQFLVRQVRVKGTPRLVKEQHVRFEVTADGVSRGCMAFRMADKLEWLRSGQPLDLVFHAELNEFMGQTTIQLTISDIRISEP